MTHAPLTFRLLLTSILSLAAAQANAACYTVYDAAGSVVHQANAPPASAAEAGTVPEGGRVMLNGAHCTSGGVAVAEQITPVPEAARAPLLTYLQTAASARTPYAVITRDIAVVAPANAEQVWQRAPLMATAGTVAPPATRRSSTEAVITEWADGRVEVERGPLTARR